MPAYDIVEPKTACTPANFLWQTLFARVDEKFCQFVLLQMSLILSLVIEICCVNLLL